MDALQWMGAVRMRVQTADKNTTIIHTTPVHQVTSGDVKRFMFVGNKPNILTLNHHFWPKYQSGIRNNASSSDKVNPYSFLTSESTHIFV